MTTASQTAFSTVQFICLFVSPWLIWSGELIQASFMFTARRRSSRFPNLRIFLIQKRLSIIGICTLLDCAVSLHMQLNVHYNWHVHWSANMLHPALISPFWWISLPFASLRIHLDPSCLFYWVAGWKTFEPLPKNLVFFGWFICASVCLLPQYSSKASPSEVCMGTSSWAGP